MFRLFLGFAVSSTLLCSACADDYGRSDPLFPGTVLFEIPSADGYSLVAAIELASQDAAAEGIPVTVSEEDSTVQVEVPAGSYTASLESFTLFRDGRAVPTADVTFVGFEPDPIIITPLSTTRVSLAFRDVDTGTDIESGDEPAELNVNRGGGCSPACDAGETCAVINGAAAACFPSCDGDTPCTAAGTECATAAGSTAGVCI